MMNSALNSASSVIAVRCFAIPVGPSNWRMNIFGIRAAVTRFLKCNDECRPPLAKVGTRLMGLLQAGLKHQRRSHWERRRKKMRLVYALLLGFLFIAPVYANDVTTEINKQNDAFDKAYAAKDFTTLGKFYDQNAVVYAQGIDVT